MLKSKFNYHNLTRESVNGQRLYACPDGFKVASVTTILDKTKPQDKRQALADWKARIGKEQAQSITTEAANRGTRVHKLIEDYFVNGKLNQPGSNPFSQQAYKMAETMIEQGLINVQEIWGSEVNLYYPEIYAGTADAIGLHNNQPAILDFKQANKIKRREWIDDYFLQLAAYATAHNELFDTEIKRGVILMVVKPDFDEQSKTWSKPQYLEFVIEGIEFQQYVDLWWDRVEQFYANV